MDVLSISGSMAKEIEALEFEKLVATETAVAKPPRRHKPSSLKTSVSHDVWLWRGEKGNQLYQKGG
jgi:hypothetical protein